MKIVLSLLLSLALLACSDGASQKPMKPLPQIRAQLQPKILWQKDLGDESEGYFLRPASDGENVYAVSGDGQVLAVDRSTGATRWSVNLNNKISAGISYGDNRLLLATKNGDLLALSAGDGRTLWRAPLGSYALSPAVIDHEMVFVRAIDGTISAFDLQDGERVWRYRLPSSQQSLRGNQTPYVGNGVVIATSDNGHMVILNQLTGLLLNEQAGAKQLIKEGSGIGLFDMDANAQINANGLLFTSVNDLQVMAVDLKKGEIAWERPGLATSKNFALNMNRLFLSDRNDHLHALEQSDGQERWHSDLLAGRQLSGVFSLEDQVGTLDREGYLHLFDEASGQPTGQIRLGNGGSGGAPLILNNQMFWQLNEGRLVAVGL